MAVLSDPDRALVAKRLMEEMSNSREQCDALKASVRALVNAADDFIDANAAAFNTAIPQPGRAQFTAKQKSRAFRAVAQRREELL